MTKRNRDRVLFILQKILGGIPAVGYVGDDGRVEVFIGPSFVKQFVFAEAVRTLRGE